MKKKLLKIVAGIIAIMTLGWMGSLFFSRYLTPILISNSFFSEMGVFDNDNKNTTIINKTEKVIVREDESIAEISSNAVYSVAEVLSFSRVSREKVVKNMLTQDSGAYVEGKKGAGTILTNDGIIVTYRTNIIEKEADYKVMTFGGNLLDATLLGIDDFTNLAFLKVNGTNLTTIPFANSDDIKFGKKVIVIGNLTGVQKVSLTEGILSTLDENFNLSGTEIASSEKLEGVLNIDFKGGDEYVGGPVINYSGELLAIGAIMEINNNKVFFHIPVDAIRDSMQKVSEKRLEQAAKLGVYYLSIDSYYKNLKNIAIDRGALVYSPSGKQGLAVMANSSAEKAGIKMGDIITSIDGNEINSSHPLSNLISQYEQGTTAVLNILRDGKEMEVNLEF